MGGLVDATDKKKDKMDTEVGCGGVGGWVGDLLVGAGGLDAVVGGVLLNVLVLDDCHHGFDGLEDGDTLHEHLEDPGVGPGLLYVRGACDGWVGGWEDESRAKENERRLPTHLLTLDQGPHGARHVPNHGLLDGLEHAVDLPGVHLLGGVLKVHLGRVHGLALVLGGLPVGVGASGVCGVLLLLFP